MKYIKPILAIFFIAILSGCFSAARHDTGIDSTFGANGIHIATPRLSLLGGAISLSFGEYSKNLTDRLESTDMTHGTGAFSKSAAENLNGKTTQRRGKVHEYGIGSIESEAHTKDFFDGLNGLAQKWLDSTPAGQALLMKSKRGEVITDEELDTVIGQDDIPDDVKSQLEDLKK